jgi:hypothetical protein
VRLSLTTKMVCEMEQNDNQCRLRTSNVFVFFRVYFCTGDFQGSMGTDENSIPQRVSIPVAGIDATSGLALLDRYRGQRVIIENPLETKNAAGDFVSGGGYGYLSGTSMAYVTFICR